MLTYKVPSRVALGLGGPALHERPLVLILSRCLLTKLAPRDYGTKSHDERTWRSKCIALVYMYTHMKGISFIKRDGGEVLLCPYQAPLAPYWLTRKTFV
jgi:hypothetical protein